jgi:hypothetical protein
MRNLMKSLAFICLTCVLSIGCTKEENQIVEKKNYLKIGNAEYELSKGNFVFIETMTIDNNVERHTIDLTLSTNGIDFKKEDNNLKITGSGHKIWFEIFSSSKSNIEYEDLSIMDNGNIGTVGKSGYCLEWSETKDATDENIWSDINSGALNIKKVGTEYEIEFNCQDLNDQVIMGYYKGDLGYFSLD